MKKTIKIVITIAFFLLWKSAVFSQIYLPQTPTDYGVNINRAKPWLVLHIPSSTTTTVNTSDLSPQIRMVNGRLMYYLNPTWYRILDSTKSSDMYVLYSGSTKNLDMGAHNITTQGGGLSINANPPSSNGVYIPTPAQSGRIKWININQPNTTGPRIELAYGNTEGTGAGGIERQGENFGETRLYSNNATFGGASQAFVTFYLNGVMAGSFDKIYQFRLAKYGVGTFQTGTGVKALQVTATGVVVEAPIAGATPYVKRVQSVATIATLIVDINSYDAVKVTALASDMLVGAPTGTPTAMQEMMIRLKDDGTVRNITWDAVFRASQDLPVPRNTIANRTMYMKFIYNAEDVKWDMIGYLNGF